MSSNLQTCFTNAYGADSTAPCLAVPNRVGMLKRPLAAQIDRERPHKEMPYRSAAASEEEASSGAAAAEAPPPAAAKKPLVKRLLFS